MTPRPLRFGHPTPAQIDGFHDAIVGSSVFDTLLWDGPESLESYRAWWQERLAAHASGGANGAILGAIDDDAGVMLGTGNVRPVHADQGVWNIGYVIAPPYQGNGVGTAMTAELTRLAFVERAAERVEAEVFVGNGASRRVLEKAGYMLEGIARSACWKRGRRVDEWRFAIIREDWEGR